MQSDVAGGPGLKNTALRNTLKTFPDQMDLAAKVPGKIL